MEILLIPIAVIAFFLYLPFGLAKFTESEKKQDNYFVIGLKLVGYNVKYYFGMSLLPLIAIAFSDSFFGNQYITSFVFVFVFYSLLSTSLEVGNCITKYQQFKRITYGYAAFGVFVCIFMFNFVGALFLVVFSVYWFIQSLTYLGKYEHSQSI